MVFSNWRFKLRPLPPQNPRVERSVNGLPKVVNGKVRGREVARPQEPHMPAEKAFTAIFVVVIPRPK